MDLNDSTSPVVINSLEPVRSPAGPSLCRDCLGWFLNGPLDCPHCGSIRIVNHPELQELAIAHIDCDAFYAAVEKRDNPALRDKPLIVGGTGGRGVVTTACYIARQYGPRSAMPMFKAREMCPHAVIISPNMSKYREVSQQIRAIFLDATPVIQPISLDEAYLDLSEDARGQADEAPATALALAAARIESEVGITVSIGLAYNKFLAKLASDLDKPRGYSVIGREEAVDFLSGLSVKKINGVGAVTAKKMAEQGIEVIGQLQAMSEAELVGRYGKFGRRLAGFVGGEDKRKVSSAGAAKSVSAESTFATDLRDAAILKKRVCPMCKKVADRLKAKDIAGRTVVLKLKTADFQILTRNRQLPYPTQNRELIFEQVAALIEAEADGRAFRLIGIVLTDLVPATEADPPNLFEGR